MVNIAQEKLQIDKSWDQFEKDFSHKLTLIKFGNGNRVYGQKNKIIKVQNIDSISDRNNFGLQQEYLILQKINNSSFSLNPKFYKKENYEILELEYFNGNFLNEIKLTLARKIYVVIKILYFLILISSKGIIYKQLRPRHVLINKLFKIKFLDFGQSKISNIFKAI